MNLLIGSILVGSVISTVFWLAAGWQMRELAGRQSVLHLVTIYLSIIAFVLLDVFVLAGILRLLDREAISLLFGFLTGIQMVAAISAFLFVRRVSRGR